MFVFTLNISSIKFFNSFQFPHSILEHGVWYQNEPVNVSRTLKNFNNIITQYSLFVFFFLSAKNSFEWKKTHNNNNCEIINIHRLEKKALKLFVLFTVLYYFKASNISEFRLIRHEKELSKVIKMPMTNRLQFIGFAFEWDVNRRWESKL